MLAAWYLVTGRGASPEGRRFCGSYTLIGWENIARSMRWSSGGAPSFPAHTSSGAGRIPGLLHMAFRNQRDGSTEDLFFVDAPGEWFRSWAVNREASEAEGARWIAEHADAFLVVADCEALAGKDRGGARNVLTQIIQRVGDERDGRPVSLVWAKSDIDVPPAIRASIETAAIRHIGEHTTFSWSVKPAATGEATDAFTGLLSWTIASRGKRYRPTDSGDRPADHFMAYGHGR